MQKQILNYLFYFTLKTKFQTYGNYQKSAKTVSTTGKKGRETYVDINITADELVNQLAVDDSLPKNFEMRTYDEVGFNAFLRMSKPNIKESRDINGVCDHNAYLKQEGKESPTYVAVLKKFKNKA